MTRAAACNYWAQGIDGLYLAHWFSYWPYEAPFYEKLRELPHPDVMAPKDKIYHIPTETGRYPRPVTEPGVTTHLPAALAPTGPPCSTCASATTSTAGTTPAGCMRCCYGYVS